MDTTSVYYARAHEALRDARWALRCADELLRCWTELGELDAKRQALALGAAAVCRLADALEWRARAREERRQAWSAPPRPVVGLRATQEGSPPVVTMQRRARGRRRPQRLLCRGRLLPGSRSVTSTSKAWASFQSVWSVTDRPASMRW